MFYPLMIFFIIVVVSGFPTQSFAKVWSVRPVTNNLVYDGWENIDDDKLAWRGIGDNGAIAILYTDLTNGTVVNLTKNKLSGDFGYPSISNGQVAWRRILNNEHSILFWDGANVKVIDSYVPGPFSKYGYPPSYSSLDPWLHKGQITYAKWDGNDYEIFLWDGIKLIQITNNTENDYEPQIYDGTLSWTGWTGEKNREDIFYWDGQTLVNITNRPGTQEDSNLYNGNVVYCSVTEKPYDTDIFLWNQSYESRILDLAGYDFEPQIGNSLITWMGWPYGRPGPAVGHIWDGFKLYSLDRGVSNVYDIKPSGNKVAFLSDDGEDYEVYVASYVAAEYKVNRTEEEILDILPFGDVIYGAAGKSGLAIVNALPEGNLTRIDEPKVQQDSIVRIYRYNTYLFTVSATGRIDVYLVAEPGKPVFVKTVITSINSEILELFINNDHIYLIGKNGSVYSYELTTDIYAISHDTSYLGENAVAAHVKDNVLYIYTAQGSLNIYDISSGFLALRVSLFIGGPERNINGLASKDGTVYLLSADYGMRILTLSSDFTPISIRDFPINNVLNRQTSSRAFQTGMIIADQFGFLTSGSRGVYVLDLSVASEPKIVDHYDIRGMSGQLTIHGVTMYVAAGVGGFAVIDISDYLGEIYEDAEDTYTNGWTVYDSDPPGAQVVNVFDPARQSRVIKLLGAGRDNGYQLLKNDRTNWLNNVHNTIKWSLKFSEPFTVYIDVNTTAGQRYLTYTPGSTSSFGNARYVQYGLGQAFTDGSWHTFVRDLQADLERAQPGIQILQVNSFLIRGSGLVDDIELIPGDSASLTATIYEDAEDPLTIGWTIYDNSYDLDNDQDVDGKDLNLFIQFFLNNQFVDPDSVLSRMANQFGTTSPLQ